MAHGSPDYWAQPSPGLLVPSVYQIPWGRGVSAPIAGYGRMNLADYLVLAGERLYITRGVISTDGPGIHAYAWRFDGAVGMDNFFDTIGHFPFNPSAVREVNTGVTLTIQVHNRDDVAHNFVVEMRGFLVTLVPGAPAPAGLGLTVDGAGI